jgi:TonB family protein
MVPFGPDNSIQVPTRLLAVLIPDGESVLGFIAQAPQPEFDAVRGTLDKIIGSFEKVKSVGEEDVPSTQGRSEESVNRSADAGSSLAGDVGEVFEVGHGVSEPEVVYQKPADYPKEARDANIEGAVLLSGVVQRDGTVRDIKVVRSLDPVLDQKAIESVSQWRFKPGMKDKVPVDVFVKLEVVFRMLKTR